MTKSQFIEILECVERGELSCAEAQSQLENDPLDEFPGAKTISALLNHYRDDEDIRQRNLDYRLMQDKELSKLIWRLHQADYLGAAKVSFLHVS